MKKFILQFMLILFTGAYLQLIAYAQAPEKMSYQAVIRNSNDQLVANQSVRIKISILKNTISGTLVYTETQTPETNANGLVSIEIGGGNGFDTIQWGNGTYFIKTETDPMGGTNFTITGTSQLLSVPYALHAKTVEQEYINSLLETIGLLPNNYSGSVADIEGNEYKTVDIGSQTWIAENLRTTRYCDNTPIPLVTDNSSWHDLTIPGYCWYDNSNSNSNQSKTYGALYNGYAVNTGKLCPTGWHIPLNVEFDELIRTLGGYECAGGKLKESGTTHWFSPNDKATNESGFTGLAAGCRLVTGLFGDQGSLASFWGASNTGLDQWGISLNTNTGYLYYSIRMITHGYSIRCIKNIEIPTDHLIASYPLNGNAHDASGNNNNGTVYGASATEDRFGNASGAMVFDGINDYIDLPDNNTLGPDITISAWVKVNENKDWARVIEYGSGEFSNNIALTLSSGSSGIPTFLVCDAGGCDVASMPTTIVLNTWNHIAFTLTGNTVTGYLNGIPVLNATAANSHEAVARTINYIGRSNFVSDSYASAVFDNIRIYDRALNQLEVIALTGE